MVELKDFKDELFQQLNINNMEEFKNKIQYLLTHDWEMPEELPPPPKWNGGKPRNRSRYTAIKYIQQLPSGKYVLQRRGVHYGTFTTIIDAVKEKLFLESIDWDYSNMETVESLEYQENKEKWRRAINE